MITIIYSTHKDKEYNEKFKTHLLTSVGLNDVQILEYQNNNQYSLAQVYNSGITESIYDIIVCCHNDIKLEKDWGKKLLEDFSNNQDFGIIGKAGSCYFSESGVYWERMMQTMVGQVWHHPKGQKKWINNYSPKLPFLVPVVTIDGLFMAFDKTKIKHQFDESFGKFHFYDHGFCVPNYLAGVKIGVTSSFEITHESIGQPNEEFYESKNKFVEKYKFYLPLDSKPTTIYVPTKTFNKVKTNGKVAVIIPTKNKLDLLFQCIESFYEHCDKSLFDIFIADTGSTEEELNSIEQLVLSVGNIKLIKYDYYNFAKINNDVVKNHIDNSYEFLLFCNNDVKLLNDVISGMLMTFKTQPKVGTVGARLHFEDNTIQHMGVEVYINSKNVIGLTHTGLGGYYSYNEKHSPILGNTGGLLMIRKFTFEKCGMFNENYISCLEDVELNLKSIILGLNNYICAECVAYHYESQTRNEDIQKIQKFQYDFKEVFLPFFNKNISKVGKFIKNVQF
jgi:GT2 family glycosyltransferase